ncbi:hypothetical protein [Hyphobacterium sp.]|uniref:hypothetical protein n=1 Tax=Hyphobacterium sp. TaxID=2004662 RepID=UPI003747C004
MVKIAATGVIALLVALAISTNPDPMALDAFYRANHEQLNRGGEVGVLQREIVSRSGVEDTADAPITISNVICFRYSSHALPALQSDFPRFEFVEIGAEVYDSAHECARNPAFVGYDPPISRCGLGEESFR